jgi:hypothetical protein
MPHRSSFLSFAVFAALAIAGAATTGACSQQSEGEPCNPSSNADDCGSNLSCISISAMDGYRCCPPVGSGIMPTTSVCSQNNTGINGGNTPPSDASTGGETGTTSPESAAPETSTTPEAGPEAASDAPTDTSSPSTSDAGDAATAETSTTDAGDAGDAGVD